MQKEVEPTYYVDSSYSSSEITTVSVPGSGSMGWVLFRWWYSHV